MKTKWVSRALCGLLAAGLLCGFAAPPAEENAGLVPKQFQTAQQVDRISVEDAISNVTIRTACCASKQGAWTRLAAELFLDCQTAIWLSPCPKSSTRNFRWHWQWGPFR